MKGELKGGGKKGEGEGEGEGKSLVESKASVEVKFHSKVREAIGFVLQRHPFHGMQAIMASSPFFCINDCLIEFCRGYLPVGDD